MSMISDTYYEVDDEVVVEVLESAGGKDTYRRSIKVRIIGRNNDYGEYGDYSYLCYIPCYEFHPGSVKIDKKLVRRFQASEEYLNDRGIIINNWTDVVKHIPRREGQVCDVCNEFIDYAEPNDAGEFTCRACKEDPYRRSF